MTVGLPGSGIGGIFYLLSALAMPFHALGRIALCALGFRPVDERRPPWKLIWRQFGMAVGIIAGLWTTGWVLAAFLVAHPTALGQVQATEIGRKLPNVLRAGAILVSVATLGGVLLTVQIARLVVASRARAVRREAKTISKIAAAALFCFIVPRARAQTADNVAIPSHLEIADRAFKDEDTATARREYEAALAANPSESRAMYRLGQLNRSNPKKAESLFKQYVRAEPRDAWGWIALGNALAAEKKFGAALDAYSRASAIAPNERDVVIGKARVLAAAGHTDAAIATYEMWTGGHGEDAEAKRELARQQIRAGRFRQPPAIEVFSAGSRDSEANQAARAGGALSLQFTDRARLQLAGSRRWLSGFTDATVNEGSVGLFARPLAAFRIEANAGVARPHSTVTVTDTIPAPTSGTTTGTGNGRGRGRNGNSGGTPPAGTIIQTESESAANVFVGALRGVLKKPGSRSSLDLRATRTLLDATPVLVINRVVRNELAGRADIEIVPRVKLRAGARAGSYSSTGDDNTRTSLLGGLAVAATDAVEVSGVFQRLSFGHSTTSGYFAPQVAQLAEAGTYFERESDNGVVLAVDAGAGAQRIQEFGTAIGKWEPSYRLFSSLDIPFRAPSAIHFELDSYDSRLGADAPSLSSAWRSISFSASLRLALR